MTSTRFGIVLVQGTLCANCPKLAISVLELECSLAVELFLQSVGLTQPYLLRIPLKTVQRGWQGVDN